MKKLKLLCAVFAVAALSAFFLPTAGAAPTEATFHLILNGQRVNFAADSRPVNVDGRTLLQLKTLFDLLNTDGTGTMDWAPADRRITLKKGSTTVILWVGRTDAQINGQAVQIDGSAPIIHNDRTYVPLRFVCDAFGMTMNWNPATATAGAMDTAQLEKIHTMINSYQIANNSLGKTSMDAALDMKVNVTTGALKGKGALSGTVDTDTRIEMDVNNNYMHAVTNSSTNLAFLGSINKRTEIYYDGQYSYTLTGDDVYKVEVPLGEIMNQQIVSIVKMDELDASCFAGLILSKDAQGNQIVEGDLVLEQAVINGILGKVNDRLDVLNTTINKLTIPGPIHFKGVFNTASGQIISAATDFAVESGLDISDGKISIVADVQLLVDNFNFNANFPTTIPSAVIEGATEELPSVLDKLTSN